MAVKPDLTVRAALSSAAESVKSESPQLDCQLLLAHAIGVDRSWLYAHGDDELTKDQLAAFQNLVRRRVSGEPVAYLTGRQSFWDLDLEVTPATLIPRPDTERLVEITLQRLDESSALTVADLGTGSGAIALALANERPNWSLIATDISAEALAVAQRNAEHASIQNVKFMEARWLDDLNTTELDAIVSNPPYIAANDSHLDHLKFEPQNALVSGCDGLADIRVIVDEAYASLKAGGKLIVEHGYDQQAAVIELMHQRGYTDVQGFSDLANQPRVTLGVKP